MRGYSSFGPGSFSAQDTPFTFGLIAANFITLVLYVFRSSLPSWLVLQVPGGFSQPWTFLTFPLVSFGIFGLLFYGLWLYFIGAALERSWGTFSYAIFFILATLVTGVSMELGALVTGLPHLSVSNWLPLAAVTLGFCLLMPYETVYLFIFPVQARWLGWGEMAIVFLMFAGISPLLGIFALAGCGFAWLWVRYRWMDIAGQASGIAGYGGGRSGFRPTDYRTWKQKINPLEWWARYKRRKQFDRLMRDDKD